MRYIVSTFLIACALGLGMLIPLLFGAELATDARVTDFHVEVGEVGGHVAALPCLGPPDETLHVGGQRILHYRQSPTGERLRACLGSFATDEMYVLVNGQGVVREFLLTTGTQKGSHVSTHLP
jgi:hypothetical protein